MSKAFGVGIQAAMGQIVTLDQNMVNMIAAGEVIERPASVVKELMENSIDAGATRITVSVEDGGRKLMSVTDDGGGMDAEDLAKAFEPHTTSKVRTSSDLLGISTLGFRGEALASIASVAQVRAASRTKDSPGANCIEIDCGNKARVGPCSGDYGTSIQVRDIFYKLPARRKFLRTANTEMGHITEQFTRIALSYCPRPSSCGRRTRQFDEPPANNLDLTLENNGREACRLAASYDLRRRVAELFPALSSASLVLGSFAGGFLLLALPLTALSAMNPVLIALQRHRRSRGDGGAGRIFFISTVGSVAGVLVTAFVFIPNMTNYRASLLLGLALCAAVALLAFRSRALTR
ncbi:MAG: ATP-binding protein, partial [Phycisphaerales bacterium]